MKLSRLFLLLFAPMLFASCTTFHVPETLGEMADTNSNAFGYHPLDPLPIKIVNVGNQPMTNTRLLNALPDETMRLAIGQVSKSGGLKFTVATAGVEGNSYVVILDYIKFNTNSFNVQLQKENQFEMKATLLDDSSKQQADVVVPVYIGIGLRLTANITVIKGSVDLGNLFAIGVQASAQKISGTLTVQTLGISGENISGSIPLPSEINATTIQNAILALGTIKAKMYEDKTLITPRVVGVYNNLGGNAETINGFISSILQKPKVLEVP